jgi:hypothetical protein
MSTGAITVLRLPEREVCDIIYLETAIPAFVNHARLFTVRSATIEPPPV